MCIYIVSTSFLTDESYFLNLPVGLQVVLKANSNFASSAAYVTNKRPINDIDITCVTSNMASETFWRPNACTHL